MISLVSAHRFKPFHFVDIEDECSISGVKDTIRLGQVGLTATDNQGSTFGGSVDSLPVCPWAQQAIADGIS